MAIQYLFRVGVQVTLVILSVVLLSCGESKNLLKSPAQNRRVSGYATDSFRYEVYQLPSGKETLALSLRIVNVAGTQSPLRMLSGNIEQYSTYYEYLLNRAAADFRLVCDKEELAPAAYSVENNYNAFPFETINISFYTGRKARSRKRKVLLFADNVFSHQVIWMKMINDFK
ncbi:hypothetical protein [Rurimicrobium arvi]|uniref:Lipoprotein n=1 Tax=Rurimicrobium arvi TaxID=2049916 RepID=A0ABP8MIE1_9BACT